MTESIAETLTRLMGKRNISREAVDMMLDSVEKAVSESLGSEFAPKAKEHALHRLDAHGSAKLAKREAIEFIHEFVDSNPDDRARREGL